MIGHRYPFHEIEKILDWPTAAHLADILGVKTSTIGTWRHRGLSHQQADALASKFNRHGSELWGQVFIDYPQYPDGTDVRPERVRPATGIGGPEHLADQAAEAWMAKHGRAS